VIIIEGPDGAGKTKLVEHLSRKYDIPVAERVVAKDTNPMTGVDLKHWTETNLKAGLQWKIFDRHRLISEPIYSACMNRKTHEGFDDIGWLTGRMIDFTRIHPFIVYCLPPYATVESNLEDDEDNTAIWGYAESIYNSYVAAAAGDIARGQAVLFNYHLDSQYERVDMLFEQWVRGNRVRLTHAKVSTHWSVVS
jgi:hypothetical protein